MPNERCCFPWLHHKFKIKKKVYFVLFTYKLKIPKNNYL